MIFSESLKNNKDFQNVYHKGTSQANRYLVMYVLRKEGPDFKGPDFKGPDFKGPDFKGPDFKGPDFKGPALKSSALKGPAFTSALMAQQSEPCRGKNEYMKNRLGIQVSKKVGNSVVRHRITRLIREAYRLNEMKFKEGMDIVVIARTSTKAISFQKGISYKNIEGALLHLAKKLEALV